MTFVDLILSSLLLSVPVPVPVLAPLLLFESLGNHDLRREARANNQQVRVPGEASHGERQELEEEVLHPQWEHVHILRGPQEPQEGQGRPPAHP